MARLVFIGRLEDLAGAAEIAFPLPQGGSLAQVIDSLPAELAAALRSPKIRIAVNGAVIAADRPAAALGIGDGDEIAFLPPVSGG